MGDHLNHQIRLRILRVWSDARAQKYNVQVEEQNDAKQHVPQGVSVAHELWVIDGEAVKDAQNKEDQERIICKENVQVKMQIVRDDAYTCKQRTCNEPHRLWKACKLDGLLRIPECCKDVFKPHVKQNERRTHQNQASIKKDARSGVCLTRSCLQTTKAT